MRIILSDSYRLPDGRPLAAMVQRIFTLQRRELLEHVRTRTTPVNFNGYVDYAVDKLLPFYLWHVAQGWKFQGQRLERALPKEKSLTDKLFRGGMFQKSVEEDERRKREKREMLALLGLLSMMNPRIVEEVRTMVREIVRGIFATTAKLVNTVLGKFVEANLAGAGLRPRDLQQAVLSVFNRPSRVKQIGDTESSRAFHYGMYRVLKETRYDWYKTWRTAADESVCALCRPLNNVTIQIDEWFVTYTSLGTSLVVKHPPIHAGTCRCRLEMFADVPTKVYDPREGVMA